MKMRRKPGWKRGGAVPPPLPAIVPTAPHSLRMAARLLRLRSARVRAEAQAGRLAGRRDGHRWIFLGSALLAWLKGEFPEGSAP